MYPDFFFFAKSSLSHICLRSTYHCIVSQGTVGTKAIRLAIYKCRPPIQEYNLSGATILRLAVSVTSMTVSYGAQDVALYYDMAWHVAVPVGHTQLMTVT